MSSDAVLSVILIYDTPDTLDIMRQVIATRFQGVAKYQMDIVSAQKLAEKLSEEHYAILFIYACGDTEEIVPFKRKVIETGGKDIFGRWPSESILICDKAARTAAYNLCKSEVFYSYETIRPIYDIGKIRLTLNRVGRYAMNIANLHHQQLERDNMVGEIEKSRAELDLVIKNVNDEQADKHGEPSADDSVSTLLEFKRKRNEMLSILARKIEKAKPQLVKTAIKQPVVIVADDQPVMQKIVRSILEPKGFKVELAANGQEVLQKLDSIKPNVILLDVDMPIMGGIETLQILQSMESTKSIPVIMLTSFSEKETFEASVEHGAIDYIIKPTSPDILLKKIRHVISVKI